MASALHAAMDSGGASGNTPTTPSQTPTTGSAPAAASPPASAPAAAPGSAPPKPAEPALPKELQDARIPLTRHQEILATTRQKQLEAAREQILEEFGPWNRLRAQFTPGALETMIE